MLGVQLKNCNTNVKVPRKVKAVTVSRIKKETEINITALHRENKLYMYKP